MADHPLCWSSTALEKQQCHFPEWPDNDCVLNASLAVVCASGALLLLVDPRMPGGAPEAKGWGGQAEAGPVGRKAEPVSGQSLSCATGPVGRLGPKDSTVPVQGTSLHAKLPVNGHRRALTGAHMQMPSPAGTSAATACARAAGA